MTKEFYDSLNDTQKKIYDNLKEYAGNELNLFMSTPNKMFNNRTPLDMLLSGNFDYFVPFIKK